LRVPSAMINLVGPSDFSGTYQLEEAQFWESQTDVFVHLYGKTETRPDRKLGHVTVTAPNLDSLMLRAREVQARMRIIPS
jgi:5-(carboxyamino)imidazole ribonucleotide synthase